VGYLWDISNSRIEIYNDFADGNNKWRGINKKLGVKHDFIKVVIVLKLKGVFENLQEG
jgi:hypothetical protein